MRRIVLTGFICFIFFLSSKVAFSQFENTDIGARSIGLMGAYTSLANNSLAIFYNPSGLGQMKYREVSVFYAPSLFGVKELSNAAFTFAEPMKGIGTFGLGVRTFGFDLYRETNIILSYGGNFRNKIYYGLNLNYYNLKIENYGSASAFGADLGAMAYLTDFLKWGFFAKNLTGSKIGESKEKLAQVYRTGFTFQPRRDLNFVLEAEKDVKYPVSIRAGMEYSILDYIDLRAGVGTEPTTFSGGIGIRYNLFQLDYALYNSQDLGLTHQAGITVNFGGDKAAQEMKEQLRNAFGR